MVLTFNYNFISFILFVLSFVLFQFENVYKDKLHVNIKVVEL